MEELVKEVNAIIDSIENKADLGSALAEYAAIVKGVAEEYGGNATIKAIRTDHPELDFMDDDEIEEIIRLSGELPA